MSTIITEVTKDNRLIKDVVNTLNTILNKKKKKFKNNILISGLQYSEKENMNNTNLSKC